MMKRLLAIIAIAIVFYIQTINERNIVNAMGLGSTIKIPPRSNLISLLDDSKETSDSKYTSYKKAYYEYLKSFKERNKAQDDENIRGKNAILIDLDKDGVPELMTFDFISSDSLIQEKIDVTIMGFKKGELKVVGEYESIKEYYSEYEEPEIFIAEKKDTKEKIVFSNESAGGQGMGRKWVQILELDNSKIKFNNKFEYFWERGEYEEYNSGDSDFHFYAVEDLEVDEDYYNKELKKFGDSIVTKRIRPTNISGEDIKNILDTYIDEPIEISYDLNKIISILGSKKFLNLKTSEKDAALEYKTDNPEIVKVTLGGEIIGLNEGDTKIKVIARKKGFQDGEIEIPITVMPRLEIDFTELDSSSTNDDIDYLKEIFATSDSFYLEDTNTLTEVSRLINFIIKKESRNTIKAAKNIIIVNEKVIKEPIKEAKKIKRTIEELLKKQEIKLNREIDATIRLDGINIKEDKPIGIRLENSILKGLKGLDFININLGQVGVTLNINNLGKNFKDRNIIQIQIKHHKDENQESYEILFTDENDNNIPKLENNLMISIPLQDKNHKNKTVFFNNGQEIEQIGGQYDPITNKMEFGTKFAGQYSVAENKKQYKDVDHLKQDVQDAIIFMTSKGFIDGKDEESFDPDGEITRAEFTSFLVNTFFVLDKTLDTSFVDIPRDSWYYNYIASSEKEGIISGFPDRTFRGDNIINREQIVAISARALYEKKGYLYPVDIWEYLSFIDSEDIADWAKKDIALAYRETLIDMPYDRYFEPQKPMSRAEATVIVYRLFQLLYETSPSELDKIDTSSASIPIIPIAVGGGVIGLGVISGYVFRRRSKV